MRMPAICMGILLCIKLLIPAAVFGQAFMKPIGEASRIAFSIRNFGISTTGTVGSPEGEILMDPNNPLSIRFDVTVASATIQTGIKARDEHLKKKDYLDVQAYPRIRFQSHSISPGSGPDSFIAHGRLTIKAISRPADIPFTIEKSGAGYLFTGSFQINRRDFGVGGASISLSDNLTISLRVITR
jgi:polyisoprenoid-binding protein YceI